MTSLIGQTVSHYSALWNRGYWRNPTKRDKILEHLPPSSVRDRTSAGQVGGGGMRFLYKIQDLRLNTPN
jgi:hypothetical protein